MSSRTKQRLGLVVLGAAFALLAHGALAQAAPKPASKSAKLTLTPATRSDSAGTETRADAYGMHSYWLGFLKRGPASTPGRTPHKDSLQAAHLANLSAMYEAGALVASGPFLDGGDPRGVVVFACDSSEAAARLAFDPAIRERLFAVELHPWYGPPGVGTLYRSVHTANPKAPDSMVTMAFGFLRRGPKWSATPTPEEQKLQEAHRAHIGAMAESGKLRVAGPFLDDSDLAGIFIFTCPIEEARAFAAEDPKVRYGWLTLEIRPWMCADGVLPQVTIPK